MNKEIDIPMPLNFGIAHDNRVITLDEVAKELKLTRERTRQIEKSALKKLKRALGARNIRNLGDIL